MTFGAVDEHMVESITHRAFVLLSLEDRFLFGNLVMLNGVIVR